MRSMYHDDHPFGCSIIKFPCLAWRGGGYSLMLPLCAERRKKKKRIEFHADGESHRVYFVPR